MTTLLYIAGRGHSGSTMLDGMLGNADGVESVGELVSGMGRYESLCSCGETFRDCPFWRGVRQRYEEISGSSWDNAVRVSVNQAHIRNLPRTIMAGGGSNGSRILRHAQSIFLKQCARTARMLWWIPPRKSPAPCFYSVLFPAAG